MSFKKSFKPKSTNLKFRQEPREYRAQEQARVFGKVRRNIPYSAFHFSKRQFLAIKQKFSGIILRKKQGGKP